MGWQTKKNEINKPVKNVLFSVALCTLDLHCTFVADKAAALFIYQYLTIFFLLRGLIVTQSQISG